MSSTVCAIDPAPFPGLFPEEVAHHHSPPVASSCTYTSIPEWPLMAQSQSPFSAVMLNRIWMAVAVDENTVDSPVAVLERLHTSHRSRRQVGAAHPAEHGVELQSLPSADAGNRV